ncbi:MAG: CocE/NonD family hydrolase [Gemmatimonadetes bacterium]|nr:CocE/NonD family hydrolase [Gemmatimonadota bacterium]
MRLLLPRRYTRSAVVLAGLAIVAQSLAAQGVAPEYTYRQAMVTVRDGIALNTVIFAPKDQREPLPFLFIRTPYGAPEARFPLANAYPELAAERYIFVMQDIRGRYKSEGQFVMQRPPRLVDGPGPRIDESTDAWDTIDWLLKNVPNHNGKVGMFGVSYPGWTTAMAMLDPHPALAAVSPQASPADMWIGDDFHHNGAFRLSYGFEYAAMMETSKENEQFAFDRYDTYDWYLKLGSLANVNAKYLKGKIPTWNDFAAHPNYDSFWQRQAMQPYLTRVTVPTLNVAGWWDQEDFYGPVHIYRTLEKQDTKSNNFLVVGPWNHGGWRRDGRTLGKIDFGAPTSVEFRANVEAPFFAKYLKGKGDYVPAEATVFESGSNHWRTFTAWPPAEAVTKSLYVQANGVLSFDAPTTTGNDSFISDPAHPVPYRNRPIEPTYFAKGSGWPVWLAEDQRFVKDRSDVLSWMTEPLAADLVLAGDVTARLHVSTTGSDADWIGKLIDVYPEDYAPNSKLGGFELMVANDVFRSRFRESLEKPKPMVPNQVTPITIDLHTQSYRFLKGHRVMVQVQSTWFPLIDRNPQVYVPNIFEARDSDFRAQTHRVWRSPSQASRVDIQVVSP